MKKLSVIMILVLFTLTLFSCSPAQKPKSDSNVNTETESDGGPIDISLSNLTPTATDIFTATVISSAPLGQETIFPDIRFSEVLTPMLYTVEVQQNIWSLTAEEKSTVDVVQYLGENENGYWSKALEVGKTYLISGLIQPYKDKVVIFSSGTLLSLMEDDSLIPVCSVSKRVLAGVNTFSDFINRDEIIKLKDTEHEYIPQSFYTALDDSEVRAEPVYKISDNPELSQKVIDIVREAVKSDSKIKISVEYDDPGKYGIDYD